MLQLGGQLDQADPEVAELLQITTQEQQELPHNLDKIPE
jgi:hypothetical protein